MPRAAGISILEGDAMKAKKTSKSTRAKKKAKDLPLAGRAGKVTGGADNAANKVSENIQRQAEIRKVQSSFE
jgi:hypothetical protein